MQIATISLLIISFLSMTTMIGRKIIFVYNKEAEVKNNEDNNPFSKDIEKLKTLVIKNTKRYGYYSLFSILRLYIRSISFLKKKIRELAKMAEDIALRNKRKKGEEETEKHEASIHLKIISEYKEKISRMKRKIKEEEKKHKFDH